MSFLIKNSDQTDIWSQKLSIPIPAIDIVIFTIYMWEVCVVLLKHELEWKNSYILPWGIIAAGYSLEENSSILFEILIEIKDDILFLYHT